VILDTLLGDSQEDATSHDVIIKGVDNEQQNARHLPLAADDRRESPIHTCPPLFGHLKFSIGATMPTVSTSAKKKKPTRLAHFRPRHRKSTKQEVVVTTHVIASVRKVT